jgi:hypothetical protein
VIPYASTILFELYKKGDKFTVKTLFNGKELIFDKCKKLANCPISDWNDHISDRLITDLTDLKG